MKIDASNAGTAAGLLGSGAILAISGILISQKLFNISQSNMFKAINIYNGVKYVESIGAFLSDGKYKQTEISYTFRF